jgi:uncharacterized membrane protein
MQTPIPQSRRLSEYTNIPFEIFVVAFTVLPFFVLAYFYPALPDRVPLFMKLNGDVAVWGEKDWLSVFRVPLMAVVTQVVCLLMKYGVLQSEAALSVESADDYGRLQKQYIALNVSLWDWFRCLVAFKMSAASLDTIFLSIERFKFLSRPAFAITFIAAMLSIAGALFYGYRLLSVKRKIKERFGDAKIQKPVDARRVYGRVMYFNPADSALFVSKYIFNFGNKWVWVFIACIIAYPLLVFLPT